MSEEFKRAKKRREPFGFHLDSEPGYEYNFTPQADAGIILSLGDADNAQTGRAMVSWITGGLSKEQGDHLVAHLKDPANEYSSEDVGELFAFLQDKAAGRPTTPPADSSD